MVSVKVVADSVCSRRVTSLECTYPTSIHAQVRTHRALSMSVQSSRAIPTERLISKVLESPVVPDFKKNRPGMQPGATFSSDDAPAVAAWWQRVQEACVDLAREGSKLGVHKQWVNRVLSPVSHSTSIITATDWNNLFSVRLRTTEDGSPYAQDEMYELVLKIKEALDGSKPRSIYARELHVPYVSDDERKRLTATEQLRVSSARCARVSYLNHDGEVNLEKDYALAASLINRKEWGPLEHCAIAHYDQDYRSGNFRGFTQYRKLFENENGDA